MVRPAHPASGRSSLVHAPPLQLSNRSYCHRAPHVQIENCRNKRAEGISLYFLLLWLFGDCCNLVGSIISGLLPLQKIIAGYYM